MGSLAGANHKLILWIGSIGVTLALGVGTPILANIYSRFDTQQAQIDDNRSRIWEQQRVTVTEETLSRRFAEIMQIVDTKIDSIHMMQREQSRQLEYLIQSQTEFQREIRDSLKEKADR